MVIIKAPILAGCEILEFHCEELVVSEPLARGSMRGGRKLAGSDHGLSSGVRIKV